MPTIKTPKAKRHGSRRTWFTRYMVAKRLLIECREVFDLREPYHTEIIEKIDEYLKKY